MTRKRVTDSTIYVKTKNLYKIVTLEFGSKNL